MEQQAHVQQESERTDDELKDLCNLIIDCYIAEKLSKNDKEC